MRISLHPAFILHSRPFSDTSLIIDMFTHGYGRVALLAKGVRNNPRLKSILAPFTPLLISWSSKAELPILSKIENNGTSYHLHKKALLSGFYLNEILVRLLHKHDPCPKIFLAYTNALAALHNGMTEPAVLREFEKDFLKQLGYGLNLTQDVTGKAIEPQLRYQFKVNHGFIKINDVAQGPGFTGANLLALHNNCFTSPEVLCDAKYLFNTVLTTLLGPKPIRSRELFFPQ